MASGALMTRRQRLADKIAAAGSAIINSLWTFAALNLLAFVPLAYPRLTETAQFISSGWFQGVALPLLGISGERQARKIIRYLQDIHADVRWLRSREEARRGEAKG